MVSVIVLSIVSIILVLLIIKEIINLKDLQSTFVCEYCGEFKPEISKNLRCSKCNRRARRVQKSYDHYFTFRISDIDTTQNNAVYKYKECVKPFKLELVICGTALAVVLIAIVIGTVGVKL